MDRDLQRRGIGTALVTEFCRRVDTLNAVSYLETDRAASVTFYERHGFETRAETTVIGVTSWFMMRSRRARPSA